MADEPVRPRCVFDCVVLLQAAVSRRGPAFALLALAEEGQLELLICQAVLEELRDVLCRPAIHRKFPLLTVAVAEAFVARIAVFATLIEPVARTFVFKRDPDDAVYVDLAVSGNADYLVTRDRDLLDLAATGPIGNRQLHELHPDLRILDPVAMLRIILKPEKSSPG